MRREGGFNVLCKFFDNRGPIPHHMHQMDEHAKRVGRRGKPESYYFFLNAVADFVAGLESGMPAQPDFESGLQTQRVCDAVLQSAENGRWVDIEGLG